MRMAREQLLPECILLAPCTQPMPDYVSIHLFHIKRSHTCVQRFCPPVFNLPYKLVEHLIQISVPLLADTQTIRIHGDPYRGNILNRLDEGLILLILMIWQWARQSRIYGCFFLTGLKIPQKRLNCLSKDMNSSEILIAEVLNVSNLSELCVWFIF